MGGAEGAGQRRPLFVASMVAVLLGAFSLSAAMLRERRAEASLRAKLALSTKEERALDAAVRALRSELAEKRAASYSNRIVKDQVLAAGNDLGKYRIMSVADAVAACHQMKHCQGFTYESSTGSAEPDIAKVFFKSTLQRVALKNWFTYERADMDAAPPEDPGYPLYLKHKDMIEADYDVERIARYGRVANLERWPEYLDDDGEVTHFSYPRPAVDRVALSVSPTVYFIPKMIEGDVAAAIIDEARAQLTRSQVARGKTDTNKSGTDKVRTSSGAWMNDHNPHAKVLRDRIEEISGIPRGSFEELQILRYEEGQKYGSHVDFFHPGAYGDSATQRVATLITFLSTVTVGGKTAFPEAMGAVPPKNAERADCSTGLRVAPMRGAGVLFYSMRKDLALDGTSLHGGCPVGHGQEKWVAVQWLRISMPDGSHPPISRL